MSVAEGKPTVIPVSSVPVFKFENSLVPAPRVPTPVMPVKPPAGTKLLKL
jgi:hypothetical protein